MILNVILLILALGVDALIYILTGLYNFIEFIWVPIIALPIIFILLWGIELLILLIISFKIFKFVAYFSISLNI